MRRSDERLPRRTVGQRRVRWMPASYRAVHALLTNPAYAGAFVFGRTTQKRELNDEGRPRRRTGRVAAASRALSESTGSRGVGRECALSSWSGCSRA